MCQISRNVMFKIVHKQLSWSLKLALWHPIPKWRRLLQSVVLPAPESQKNHIKVIFILKFVIKMWRDNFCQNVCLLNFHKMHFNKSYKTQYKGNQLNVFLRPVSLVNIFIVAKRLTQNVVTTLELGYYLKTFFGLAILSVYTTHLGWIKNYNFYYLGLTRILFFLLVFVLMQSLYHFYN